MFCQKCGVKNPDNGKFCRSCGTDLNNNSAALTGQSGESNRSFGIFQPIQPIQPAQLWNKKGKPASYEQAITKLFTGLAFLIVAAVLGITGVAGGQFWWFWMLIPAFGSLGSGVAQYVQLKKTEKLQSANFTRQTDRNVINSAPQNSVLPPGQTDYIAPDSRYQTGELVPPSVVENTTRHLEMDSEGETMTLPRK